MKAELHGHELTLVCIGSGFVSVRRSPWENLCTLRALDAIRVPWGFRHAAAETQ
jgi:hypothetical protein